MAFIDLFSPNIEKMIAVNDIDGLIKALSNKNETIKIKAIEALGNIQDEKALGPLVQCLFNYGRDEIRDEYDKAAATALTKYGNKFIDQLRKKHEIEQCSPKAFFVLGNIGTPEAIDFIVEQSYKRNNNTALPSALEILNKIKPRAVEVLLKNLKSNIELLNTNECLIRDRAIIVLGDLGDKRVVDPIINIINKTETESCVYGIEALYKIDKEKAILTCFNKIKDYCYKDYRTIDWRYRRSSDGGRVINRLLEFMWENYNDKYNAEFVPILQKFSKDRVTYYDSTNPESTSLSRAAIYYLDKIQSAQNAEKPVVERLIAVLECNDQRRFDAAIKLGELGDVKAVEPLIALIKDEWGQDDEEAKFQNTIAIALGKIGDKRAVEPLISRSKGYNKHVRAIIACVLGQLGDNRAVNQLIALLSDNFEEVRYYAAKSLGLIGDDRAVQSLVNALNDSDEKVRKAAIESLQKLGWMSSGDGFSWTKGNTLIQFSKTDQRPEKTPIQYSKEHYLQKIYSFETKDAFIELINQLEKMDSVTIKYFAGNLSIYHGDNRWMYIFVKGDFISISVYNKNCTSQIQALEGKLHYVVPDNEGFTVHIENKSQLEQLLKILI